MHAIIPFTDLAHKFSRHLHCIYQFGKLFMSASRREFFLEVYL